MAKVVADHDDLQHIEGICKWVNSEQIFFWYQLMILSTLFIIEFSLDLDKSLFFKSFHLEVFRKLTK